jgi:hypothetical protein
MAMGKILAQEPGEIEMLLPWHAAGTLIARDARRVEEALAREPGLAKQYAFIRQEYAETIELNKRLGAPSARPMQKLFTTIDAEPVRKPTALLKIMVSARCSTPIRPRLSTAEAVCFGCSSAILRCRRMKSPVS